MKFRQMFAAAAIFVVFLAAGSGVKYDPGPFNGRSDSLQVPNGATVTRALHVKGASKVGLYVPTLTATALTLQVGFDTDSTFVGLAKESVGGDTLKVWTLHNGTGAFGIDITQWVAGFDYFRIVCGSSQAAVRTFWITTKW